MARSRKVEMEPLLLTVEQVMAATGFGRNTVYGMISSGELEYVRYGRAIRVPTASLKAWIEQHKTMGGRLAEPAS